MMYKCQRCYYMTDHKGNFKNHLNRKRVCKPLYSDVCIEVLKKELENDSKSTSNDDSDDEETTKDIKEICKIYEDTLRERATMYENRIRELKEEIDKYKKYFINGKEDKIVKKDNVIVIIDDDTKYNTETLEPITKNINTRNATLILLHNIPPNMENLHYITGNFLDDLNNDEPKAIKNLIDYVAPEEIIN